MVSVIIPTLNAETSMDRLLQSLKKQSCSPEIIVIDSSSSDNTPDIVKDHAIKMMTVERHSFNHGGTRTLGGKAADGNILVYLTQDALPADENTIENLIKPLMENEGVGASYGRQLPHLDATPFAAHLRLFNYPPHSSVKSFEDKTKFGIKTAFLSNSFAAYKRNALDEIGWFKDGLMMGEDVHAAARLLMGGYQIAYTADALVYHSHNHTVAQEFKRYFDIGAFHQEESWMMKAFGRAEGEGLRYVESEVSYLLKCRKPHLLFASLLRNTLKYVAYRLGQNSKL